MEQTLTDRVWGLHPLAPAHRCVLLAIARQVPEGRTEVLVNRGALARDVEASAEAVRRALVAGEHLGLLRIMTNGVVAFVPVALPGMGAAPAVGVAPAGAVKPRTGRDVQEEFGRQWGTKYRQRYVFQHPKDDKLAAGLKTLQPDDLSGRVRAYLSHPDQWYAQMAHAFSIFVRDVNKFGGTAESGGEDEWDRAERRAQQRVGR